MKKAKTGSPGDGTLCDQDVLYLVEDHLDDLQVDLKDTSALVIMDSSHSQVPYHLEHLSKQEGQLHLDTTEEIDLGDTDFRLNTDDLDMTSEGATTRAHGFDNEAEKVTIKDGFQRTWNNFLRRAKVVDSHNVRNARRCVMLILIPVLIVVAFTGVLLVIFLTRRS